MTLYPWSFIVRGNERKNSTPLTHKSSCLMVDHSNELLFTFSARLSAKEFRINLFIILCGCSTLSSDFGASLHSCKRKSASMFRREFDIMIISFIRRRQSYLPSAVSIVAWTDFISLWCFGSFAQIENLDPRGVQLAALFMSGVDMALLANDACGQPIPWEHCCPWMYFDGKLLQSKLIAATREKVPLLDLCDGQVSGHLAVCTGNVGTVMTQGSKYQMKVAGLIYSLLNYHRNI